MSRAGKRYADEGEIARGGMGVVFRVKDRNLDRTLAMKRMMAAPDILGGKAEVDRFARFMEEAHVTAQLDHPGIVPVHDLGEDENGCAYYTMKLVRGRELGEVIKVARKGEEGWNLPRLVGVLVRACQAVAYAHGKGVIHRDLKPANIMVGELGEVYVMDWGLAKQVGRDDVHDIRPLIGDGVSGSEVIISSPRSGGDPGSSVDSPLMTRDGAIIGTPAYMPPEQAAGEVENVDQRADIYALGAVLYEMLATVPPYHDQSQSAEATSEMETATATDNRAQRIITSIASGPPTRVRDLRPDAPAELVAVCEKAMARDRERRYASCLDLAEDLQAYLDGRVVQAHETGALAELKKWVLRNKATSAAAAAAVLALAALAALQSVSNQRLSASLKNEEAAREEATFTLADMHRNAGLREENPARAALWFSKAALLAQGDPARVLANQTRAAMWGREAWQPVRAFQTISGEGAIRFAFHPTRNLLIAETYHGVEVWDLDAEAPLALPETHLASAAFSPDGAWLAAGGRDGKTRLYAVPDFEVKAEIPHRATALAFDAASARLALGHREVRVWDLKAGEANAGPFAQADPAHWLGFSPSGDRLAVAAGTFVQIYDPSSGSAEPLFAPTYHDSRSLSLKPFFFGGRLQVVGMAKPEVPADPVFRSIDAQTGEVAVEFSGLDLPFAVSPDGTQLLCRGGIWDWRFHDLVRPMRDAAYGDSGAFHPSGGLFVNGQGSLGAWTSPGIEPLGKISVRNSQAAGWNPAGTLLAIGSPAGLIQILRTAVHPAAVEFTTGIAPAKVALSRGGEFIANPGWTPLPTTGDRHPTDKAIVARIAKTGEPAGPHIIPGGHVCCAEFGADGSGLLAVGTGVDYVRRGDTGMQFGAVQLFDFRTGDPLGERIVLPSEPADILRLPGSSDAFIILCRHGEIARLSPADAKVEVVARVPMVTRIYTERRNGQLQWAEGGKALLASGSDQTHCLDFPSGRLRWSIDKSTIGGFTAAAAGGGYVAVATSSPYKIETGVLAIDLATGGERHPVDAGIFGANWLAFDQAGERLLAAGGNHLVQLFRAGAWERLGSPVEHIREGASAAFLEGLPWVASAGADDGYLIWDPATGLEVAPRGHGNGSLWIEQSGGGGDTLILASRNNRKFAAYDLGHLHRAASLALSAENALRLAEINAEASIDENQNLHKLGEREWLEKWRAFRREFPRFHDGALNPAPSELAAWHRSQALDRRPSNELSDFAVRWHLGEWQRLQPGDPLPLARFLWNVRPTPGGDFAETIQPLLADPRFANDPVTLSAICAGFAKTSGPAGSDAWNRVDKALLDALGYPQGEPPDDIMATRISRRVELPESVRARLIKILIDKPPPLETEAFKAAVAAGGSANAPQLAARWDARDGATPEGWRDPIGGDHLAALGGPVAIASNGAVSFGDDPANGAFFSDPQNAALGGATAFTAAIAFRPADQGEPDFAGDAFYCADQLISADHPYNGDDWGLGYAGEKVWFGVGDAQGGTPTLQAAPGGGMAARPWIAVASWAANDGTGAPSIALWVFDREGKIAALAGPADPNVLTKGDASRFRAPRQPTGIAIGADRGEPTQHRYRGQIYEARLYQGAAKAADAAAIAGELAAEHFGGDR
ncbi:MAG: serine/threonine-protein kinase [Verrucomicrobiales bacterium]